MKTASLLLVSLLVISILAAGCAQQQNSQEPAVSSECSLDSDCAQKSADCAAGVCSCIGSKCVVMKAAATEQLPAKNTSAPAEPKSNNSVPASQPAQQTQQFSIDADDSGFYIDGKIISSISVAKGDTVKITYNVRSTNVYYNGLDFKGCGQTAGAKPGSSAQLEFTATDSCTITSYWPSTGIVKDSMNVAVQ